jgi:phosphate-selective porin OprO/OprP
MPLTVNQSAVGLEGIFATGPFKRMGEYSNGRYKGTGDGQTKYDTKTYFVEAGWFITGEKFASSYKNGVFSSFKPINEFDPDKNNWGAVEAIFRFEGYDVDNATVSGGRLQGNLDSYSSTNGKNENTVSVVESGAKTYTGGIRWILNTNVVLKGNFSYTKFDNAFAPIDVAGATAIVKDEKVLSFRTQFMF